MRDIAQTMTEQSFFRCYPADYAEKYDGNVEAPCGFFMKVFLDTETFEELRAELNESDSTEYPTVTEWLSANNGGGFVLITTDNNGLVWAETYSRDDDDSVDGAYARALKSYEEWDDEDDDYELQDDTLQVDNVNSRL